MFAANADVFAPGDSFGIPTTTDVQRVPHGRYSFKPPSIVLGAAALLVVLMVNHHLGRGRGKRR